MRRAVSSLLREEGIREYAILPISAVRVLRPELFLRDGEFSPKSLLVFLVPYYAGPTENLSLYAAARDYHRYMHALTDRLASAVREAVPGAVLRGFSDHSPIDERYAAAVAGLGVLGDNGLLINPTYGSFVFIGALFSDLPPDEEAQAAARPLSFCEHCGACREACPTGSLSGKGDCLSELTQRKGELTDEEKALMIRYNTAWGCDICQSVCPYNKNKTVAPLPFFEEDRVCEITSELIENMSKTEFEKRAFSWRGRKTVLRNAAILESAKTQEM